MGQLPEPAELSDPRDGTARSNGTAGTGAGAGDVAPEGRGDLAHPGSSATPDRPIPGSVPALGSGSRTRRRFVKRAEGDRRARARLRLIKGEGVILLNDRRVPGSKSSIKLIAVSSGGVFVIATEKHRGLVHTRRTGPMWDLGPQELHVGRKNCTSSVANVAQQMGAVRAALDTTQWGSEVPTCAVLCLTRAEWGFASALEISDVYIGWPKLVAGRVQAPGGMDSPAVHEASEMIAEHLPVS